MVSSPSWPLFCEIITFCTTSKKQALRSTFPDRVMTTTCSKFLSHLLPQPKGLSFLPFTNHSPPTASVGFLTLPPPGHTPGTPLHPLFSPAVEHWPLLLLSHPTVTSHAHSQNHHPLRKYFHCNEKVKIYKKKENKPLLPTAEVFIVEQVCFWDPEDAWKYMH